MERLLQYWDDLDDLWGAIGLVSEKIRGVVLGTLIVTALLILHVGGIWLALRHPPLASATATILVVTLLYQLATSRHPLK